MKLQYDKNILSEINQSSKIEWLETNGLGGWASSTITGMNTRRYHGLLVAATNPPVGRVVLLSKLDEAVILNDKRYELSSNYYPGTVHPKGFEYLKTFERKLFPETVFQIENLELKKTISAINGENTTVIIYEVLNSIGEIVLELTPFLSGRDYHSLNRRSDLLIDDIHFSNSTLHIKFRKSLPDVFIKIKGAEYSDLREWYYNFEYPVERYRGLDFQEDLFLPGMFRLKLKPGSNLGIVVSTEEPEKKNPFELFEKEKSRREKLIINQDDELQNTLTLSADQFIVKRGNDLKTIIAGYHWFSDWGRDTMIALPGICLSTERYDDAIKILSAFAQSVNMGMLPNRFPDYGEEPEYNTVDATLWFFVAVYEYYLATGNFQLIKEKLLDVLKNILDWHYKGTRYNINADEDGLLFAGQDGQQLTWMDAKINDWVVTPRIGKPVEINALWYNALRIYSEFAALAGKFPESKEFSLKADKTAKSFLAKFWNEDKQYLYDCINNDYKDDTLRPNQLFAISLPFQLIENNKAQKILNAIEQNLYTPVGLRSLSPLHTEYKPVYGGNQLSRDSAYHQGTVWSWLLGPYVDAIIKVEGENGKQKAKKIISSFKYHLKEACAGSVSEIFDAENPHSPRGCIAQAWGVGEILRVYKKYQLFDSQKKSDEFMSESLINNSIINKQKERINI